MRARNSIRFERVGRTVLAGASFLAFMSLAWARDDTGVRSFFSAPQQGAVEAPAPHPFVQTEAPAPAPRSFTRRVSRIPTRALTVRLHQPRATSGSQVAEKAAKSVSIYEDRTLRRGDAVMMRTGLRIFVGSRSWPYTDDDFVAISDAGQVDQHWQKTLADLDRPPKS